MDSYFTYLGELRSSDHQKWVPPKKSNLLRQIPERRTGEPTFGSPTRRLVKNSEIKDLQSLIDWKVLIFCIKKDRDFLINIKWRFIA